MRLCAEIDLRAARENLRAVARTCAGARVLAVVKADAYGHGAVPLARALEAAGAAGAAGLGVADLTEAAELQDAGIELPIQVLGSLLAREVREAVRRDIVLTISSAEEAGRASAAAAALGKGARVHLKVDTGMGRLGAPPDEALSLARRLVSDPALKLAGLMTHLSSAASDEAYTREQLARFEGVRAVLADAGLSPGLAHAANSAAGALYPEARFDMVRPGLALYGASEDERATKAYGLAPVLTLRAALVLVKDVGRGASVGYDRTWTAARPTRLGVLACGYADGVPRALSNRGEVLVRGRRAPVVGRVSMDYAAVDLTDVPGAAAGDEAVLVGGQGDERIRIEEVARHAGLIPYEVMCGLGRRVQRIYRDEPGEDEA